MRSSDLRCSRCGRPARPCRLPVHKVRCRCTTTADRLETGDLRADLAVAQLNGARAGIPEPAIGPIEHLPYSAPYENMAPGAVNRPAQHVRSPKCRRRGE